MSWRKHIENAFEKARSLGSTSSVPARPRVIEASSVDLDTDTPAERRASAYTAEDEMEFQRRKDALLAAVENDPRIHSPRLSAHRARSWWVGSLPTKPVDYEAVFAKALKALAKEKPAEKQSLLAKAQAVKIL